MSVIPLSRRRGPLALAVIGALAALVLAGCGSGSGSSSDGGKISVSLITKDSVNPFFIAMQKGAKKAAAANGVQLTVGAGAKDGDVSGQVKLIEDAIARGDKGILITPNGPGVNPSMKKARDAGLYVIALDTPPDPPSTVDITFATDNRQAGKLIGQWTAQRLNGQKATIALLDLSNSQIVSVDYNRDQGFLSGMGIPLDNPNKNGDEAPTGRYTGGKGGDYQIVCNEPGGGAQDGGKTAMENCLAKNPSINVVYTINEPTAYGADQALGAAKRKAVLMVSVDGGCQAMDAINSGIIDATSQQYPVQMAKKGVVAIKQIATGGATPSTSAGLDFFNTGVKLVTNTSASGVPSITANAGKKICWG